ncbi:MAG: RuBisCO large subunit C-terminal-like domain-containing protein [Omnitrophica WOR_2 bacterium]
MKRIFDPDMFNFQWESINHDRYIVATYYIEDTLEDQDWVEHLTNVQRMALEGSTSSWMRVAEDSGEVREKLTSKVLGYYEVPIGKPHTKAAVIQLGFPIDAWDINLNVPMMLLTIAGNVFAFSTKARLLDVYFPKELAQRFKGPKYGIQGIREKLGVYDRPLILHIIKPKMGMTPEETANQVYQTALGGADLCKDDEMLSELDNSPWEKRLETVLKSIDKAERETGHKMLYMLSITDEINKVNEKARKAVAMGASGLLLAYSTGPSMLRLLTEDPEVKAPVLLHVSHMLSQIPMISFPVFSKLCRLCGADMMLSPCMWTSIPMVSPEESARNYQVMVAPMYHIKPTFPMPAAGMYPGLVPVLMEEFGIDQIIPAGGGMLGHKMGYTAGAKAWRQAIDATLKGISLQEAAKSEPELRAAIEQWGVRTRPQTAWGYGRKEHHPAFAPKDLE